MEVRKIRLLSPEHAEPGGEGGVTVAPDSRCCISIATGSSLGLPLCLSPLYLSVCVCPVGQKVEASPKVGHEKMELTDMTPLLWEGQKFLQISEMSQRCMFLPAAMIESGTHLCLSV